MYKPEPKDEKRAVDAIRRRILDLPREQVSAWMEAHDSDGRSGFPLEIETCHLWTPEHLDSVRVALIERVMSFSDPLDAQAMLWCLGPVMRIVSSSAIAVAMARNGRRRAQHTGNVAASADDIDANRIAKRTLEENADLVEIAATEIQRCLLSGSVTSPEMRRRMCEADLAGYSSADLAQQCLFEVDDVIAPSPFRRVIPWLTLHIDMLSKWAKFSLDKSERVGKYGCASGIARAKSDLAGSVADGLEACFAVYGNRR